MKDGYDYTDLSMEYSIMVIEQGYLEWMKNLLHVHTSVRIDTHSCESDSVNLRATKYGDLLSAGWVAFELWSWLPGKSLALASWYCHDQFAVSDTWASFPACIEHIDGIADVFNRLGIAKLFVSQSCSMGC